MIVPSVESERQRIMEAVFKPVNMPTMTMEEYMKANPHEFTPAPPQPQPSEEEQEDSDNEEVTYKKRAWDDWVDEHPKGAGNRMANIG